ncbi:MAG TPA: hypothetical protein VES38_02285 [Methylotenera sp.]|nr:hypothetical protein [Methylotenera sp.]
MRSCRRRCQHKLALDQRRTQVACSESQRQAGGKSACVSNQFGRVFFFGRAPATATAGEFDIWQAYSADAYQRG